MNEIMTEHPHLTAPRPASSYPTPKPTKTSALLLTNTNSNPLLNYPRDREKSKKDHNFRRHSTSLFAETADDMIKAFQAMEASFNDKDLGLASLKLAHKLDQEGEYPEKVLSFALKALNVLDTNDDANSLSLPLALCLQLLGSSCFNLKMYNDSLRYLNRANRMLGKLEEEGSCDDVEIRYISHAVQLNLATTKTAIGRREDALGHFRRCLKIKEAMLEPNSRELGNACRDMAEAYASLLNFKEALPYCVKGLKIHRLQLGNDSEEVAHDRKLLGVIYSGLEEHHKALEQNLLSQKVLKKCRLGSDLVRAEIDAANMQIAVGKYDEAVGTLKGVVQQTDKEGQDRALVLVLMAKALSHLEKFRDCKSCLDIACGILDKKEKTSSLEVSEAYMEISTQYEAMNEFEPAISLLERAQAMLEKLPQEQHFAGSVAVRIGLLLMLTGKVQQAIPYLEDAAERLKESFGSKHYGLGYIYNNLGAAYLELDKPQLAVQMYAVAKEIMDISVGPQHVDSTEACHNLSKAYFAMGSYSQAINFQEKVVEAWKSQGPSAEDELEEATQLLQELNRKALAASLESKRASFHDALTSATP